MKRLLLIVLCMGSFKLYAGENRDGMQYVIPSAWRSTNTAATANFVSITTCNVDFGGVMITSPGIGGVPSIGIYDGSNNLIISTISSVGTQSPNPYGYGVKFSSSGLRFSNTGTSPATITIFYNYRGPICSDPFRVW